MSPRWSGSTSRFPLKSWMKWRECLSLSTEATVPQPKSGQAVVDRWSSWKWIVLLIGRGWFITQIHCSWRWYVTYEYIRSSHGCAFNIPSEHTEGWPRKHTTARNRVGYKFLFLCGCCGGESGRVKSAKTDVVRSCSEELSRSEPITRCYDWRESSTCGYNCWDERRL